MSESASRYPKHSAVKFGARTFTYQELENLSNQVANVLVENELQRGDRVGIFLPKSRASILSIFSILKAGGTYVPLDHSAPSERLELIIRDCGISALLTNSEKMNQVSQLIKGSTPIRLIGLVDCDLLAETRVDPARTIRVKTLSWPEILAGPGRTALENFGLETETAYILYTSGSTGTPKGVMISHRNSLTFVNWASKYVGLSPDDVVSSHAPIHFDLSIFDIFASVSAGATMVLVPEGASTFPINLTKLIERERITVWYSVPSALTLMVLYGSLGSHNLSSLRTVIFAGEVFPVKYLRRLQEALGGVRLLNWYGPTETNVCTTYEVPTLDSENSRPIPIGKACQNTDVFAVSETGKKVMAPAEEGELYVRGPSVMQGYWGDSVKTSSALMQNPFNENYKELLYKTGDIVTLNDQGDYIYVGRRDGMVKTRGYRVELGEIETALYSHPDIREAAVIAVSDELIGNRLIAVVSLHDEAKLEKGSISAYLSEKLPHYMIPDKIDIRGNLSKTSTGKIDRVSLRQENEH